MPLCVQCADVWSHDWDRWNDTSAAADVIREKANAWQRAMQAPPHV